MANPWGSANEAIRALFEQQLGISSDYDTLQVVTIKSIIARSWSDFDKWAFPAIAIVGRVLGRSQTEHGGLGSRRMGKLYDYTMIGLVEGTLEQASEAVGELDKRIEQALLVRNLTIDGEAFRIATPKASALTSGRRPSNLNADWCYAATVMAVTIETST